MADNTANHTQLCRAIEHYVLWCGGYIVKNLGTLGQRRGRPDMDGCVRGRAIFIEAKTGKGELTGDQIKERNRIEIAGGIYIEARSVDDVERRLVEEGLALPSLLS